MTISPSTRLLSDLENAIRCSELRPGDKLPGEEFLASKYRISRPAVREALQKLKARGLVLSRRGSGNYVSSDEGRSSLVDMLGLHQERREGESAFFELMELRILLECWCVGSLAKESASDARRALRGQLARMRQAKKDLDAFGKADIAFHLLLVDLSENELFSTILHGLLPSIGMRYAKETYRDSLQPSKILKEHTEICEFLEAGNARGAERSLRRHLTTSLKHYLAAKAGRPQSA